MMKLVDVAAIGTQQRHIVGNEKGLLHEAGIGSLQRQAGYIPLTMPTETSYYQPVSENYAACADAMMMRLCHQVVIGANPRVPYLVVAWLLLGADNPFCIRRYAPHRLVIPRLAGLFLRIACGDEPSSAERQAVMNADAESRSRISAVETAILRATGLLNANKTQAPWVAWLASAVVSELVRFKGNKVEATVWKQARAWCYMTDDEAGRIARKLFFEMLDGTDG